MCLVISKTNSCSLVVCLLKLLFGQTNLVEQVFYELYDSSVQIFCDNQVVIKYPFLCE